MNIQFIIRLVSLIALGFATTHANAGAESSDLRHIQTVAKTSEGYSLAAYISRPAALEGPLPTLFLTQSVSCGSVAPNRERLSLHERLAVEAGYALIRIDRAGMGESEGPGCDNLDYDTEVRHYREAFDQLAGHEWIDRSKIFIVGSSLGSTTAPLVALGKPVAGVIVQGGGALTYFERMLHFDRLQLERQANFAPGEIGREMQRRIEFHTLYLHQRMTPDEIASTHPHLGGVWESLVGTDAEPHYGRPHAWHWQAAEKDWLAAWSEVNAPVMVVYGEYEQFESRHGHRVIVDTINRLRPGTAQWLEIARAGHGLRIYQDPVSAYAWEGAESKPELFVKPVSEWLRQVAGQP